MGSFISFVPTPFEEIESFFQLAPVSSDDVVYDLGSGDGRLLFAALEKGAGKAVGVELDATLVDRARMKAKENGLEDRVTFLEADVMDTDLSPASVVLGYLITSALAVLRPKFETELKPGTRVVMESFPIRGWRATEIRSEYGHKMFFLYRMPPELAGPDEQGGADYGDFNYYFEY